MYFIRNIYKKGLNSVSQFENIVNIQNSNVYHFYGVGGNYLIGEFLKSIFHNYGIAIDVKVYKQYEFIKPLSEKDIIIFCSYSGDTEEVIIPLEELLRLKLKNKIIGLTSGGKLLDILGKNECILFEANWQARVYLPFSMINVINSISIDNPFFSKELFDSIKKLSYLTANILDSSTLESNVAIDKELLEKIAHKNKIPIIFYDTNYFVVAERLREQLCENNKLLAHLHEIPHYSHNEINNRFLEDDRFIGIFIKGTKTHERNLKRMQITKEIIESKGTATIEIDMSKFTNDYLQEFFYGFFISDVLSHEIHDFQEGIPFTKLPTVEYFKKKLSE